ncbi:plasmid pRiA4b ORF-3 family protein [Streptococcus rifensis]
MEIALTQKLKKRLPNVTLESGEDLDPFYKWTINVTNVFEDGEDDLLVMTNQETRFPVLIYNIDEFELEEMPQEEFIRFLMDKLRESLKQYGYSNKAIEAYCDQAGAVTFTKNSQARQTSWNTNTALTAAAFIGDEVNSERLVDEEPNQVLSYLLRDFLFKIGDNYHTPNESMATRLKGLVEESVYEQEAFELRLSLNLETFTIVRQIMLSASASFLDLHKVIQKLMRWQDYHLYLFELEKNGSVEKFYPFEDELWDGKLARDYRLESFLEVGDKFSYTYDFGNNWEFDIEVLSFQPNFQKELPYVIKTRGNAPSEDASFDDSYFKILEVLSDPEHPEYDAVNTIFGKVFYEEREVDLPLSKTNTFW